MITPITTVVVSILLMLTLFILSQRYIVSQRATMNDLIVSIENVLIMQCQESHPECKM